MKHQQADNAIMLHAGITPAHEPPLLTQVGAVPCRLHQSLGILGALLQNDRQPQVVRELACRRVLVVFEVNYRTIGSLLLRRVLRHVCELPELVRRRVGRRRGRSRL